jgi:hypothetical protein
VIEMQFTVAFDCFDCDILSTRENNRAAAGEMVRHIDFGYPYTSLGSGDEGSTIKMLRLADV